MKHKKKDDCYKALACLYISIPEGVANDINQKIRVYISELENGRNSMYVYIRLKGEKVYTVGFYSPDGEWNSDSDCDTVVKAAERVHYLNGGNACGSRTKWVRPTGDKNNNPYPAPLVKK